MLLAFLSNFAWPSSNIIFTKTVRHYNKNYPFSSEAFNDKSSNVTDHFATSYIQRHWMYDTSTSQLLMMATGIHRGLSRWSPGSILLIRFEILNLTLSTFR